MRRPLLVARLLATTLLGAAGAHPAPLRAQAAPLAGIDPALRDTTCAPCRDFYQYANGAWLATATIPPDRADWSPWIELVERNEATLHAILDSLDTGVAAAGTPEAKAGLFYRTCMDSARAEREGARPLSAELARIDAVASEAALRDEIAALQRLGIGLGFGIGAEQDPRHSTQVILHLSQGGLGLPDRDYYTRPDSAAARMRREYVAHVARTLALSGLSPAQATQASARIMALETKLAAASMTVVERRDPNATYHLLTITQIDAATPGWSWPAYLRATGAPAVHNADVEQPAFFAAFGRLLRTVPLADWKSYLRWHYVAAAAPFLSSPFVQENFRFVSLLTGVPVLRPRWKRCLTQTDDRLGEALGRVYVARAFRGEAKTKALALVRNLEAVLRDDLSTLSWMSTATRQQAIAKLAAFTNKVGYPDTWRDYTTLLVGDGPFWSDVEAAGRFEVARNFAKIGRPLDRGEWAMTPPTVNAYYSPPMNEIVFPAGILQPPFFDPTGDDAVNYGAIGMVIGHEMTHGFDDAGRKFDKDGNLRDWWTPQDAAAFTARAARVASQYAAYVAVDSLRIDGHQTLGENIADIGGLKLAYAAYERALAGQPRTFIAGLSPEQRFFVAFAQAWRWALRPEYERTLLHVDVHSPPKWRVDGAVSNLPEFARAFGCATGDAMVRPDSARADIW
jgi:putative endopeptidase